MKSTIVLLSSTLLLSALIAQVYAAEFPPQDHGGADLVFQDGDVIWGRHTGIGSFQVPEGVELLVARFDGDLSSGRGTLEVYADEIVVGGQIEASAKGYSGGGGGGANAVNNCNYGTGRPPNYPVPIYDPLCSFPDQIEFGFLGGAKGVEGRDHFNGGYGDGPGGGCPMVLIPDIGFTSPTPGRFSITQGLPDTTMGLETSMGSGGGGSAGQQSAISELPFFCAEDGRLGGTGGGGGVLFGKEKVRIAKINNRGRSGGSGPGEIASGSGGMVLLYSPSIEFATDPPLVYVSPSRGVESLGTTKTFGTLSPSVEFTLSSGRRVAGSINGAFPMATTFFEAKHNWEFFSIDGYPASIPSEDSPTGAVIHRANGPESLGLWQSPVYTTGKESSLVRARFTVHSSTPTAQVPTFRMRSLDDDGTETAELWIDSRADGLNSPTEEGRRYEQYFDLNDGDLRYAFDMVHFQESNAADGEVSLEILEATDVTLPDDVRSDHVYTFESGNNGWSPVTIPEIQGPLFSQDNGSLSMVADTPDNVFGFWTSPDDVTIDPNRLYIATFLVESDSDDATTVPAFRCRLNESGFDTAAVLHVSSEGPADRSPTVGNPQEYRVYLRPSGVRDDSKLLVSFDLLSFMDDDPETTVSLREVRIESVALSDMPQ